MPNRRSRHPGADAHGRPRRGILIATIQTVGRSPRQRAGGPPGVPSDRQAVREAGGALTRTPARASGNAVPALAVDVASDELLDAVTRLLRLLSRPRDLPVLGPMARREILWLLITGPQGETVRQLGLPDSKISHIARFVHWLRDHAAEPMRVSDLARHADLNVSAFHRTFHAVTGSSPLPFQKQLRLLAALRARPAWHPRVFAVCYGSIMRLLHIASIWLAV